MLQNDPRHATPKTESPDPSRANERQLIVDPRCIKSRILRPATFAKPYTDKDDPTLTKLRQERLLPKCVKSNTDTILPSRVEPQILIPLPSLTNARVLRDEPRESRFKMDMLEARWDMPYTDTTDPIRAKERTEKALPKVRQSSEENEVPQRSIPKIDTVLPIRDKPRRLILEPKWMKSSTEHALPKRDIPYTEKDDPMRAKERRESDEPIMP
jgi:hypothetical protein